MHEELCRVRDRLLLDQALTDLDDVACLLPFQPVGLVKIRLNHFLSREILTCIL